MQKFGRETSLKDVWRIKVSFRDSLATSFNRCVIRAVVTQSRFSNNDDAFLISFVAGYIPRMLVIRSGTLYVSMLYTLYIVANTEKLNCGSRVGTAEQ